MEIYSWISVDGLSLEERIRLSLEQENKSEHEIFIQLFEREKSDFGNVVYMDREMLYKSLKTYILNI